MWSTYFPSPSWETLHTFVLLLFTWDCLPFQAMLGHHNLFCSLSLSVPPYPTLPYGSGLSLPLPAAPQQGESALAYSASGRGVDSVHARGGGRRWDTSQTLPHAAVTTTCWHSSPPLALIYSFLTCLSSGTLIVGGQLPSAVPAQMDGRQGGGYYWGRGSVAHRLPGCQCQTLWSKNSLFQKC